MPVRDFDTETIEMINLFEDQTGSEVRDCILHDNAYFVVEEGNAGRAIGKNGANVKRLQKMLNRRIKIWEYSEDTEEFVENMIPEAEEVAVDNTHVTVTVKRKDRGRVIGKGGENINTVREFLQRNTDAEELELK